VELEVVIREQILRLDGDELKPIVLAILQNYIGNAQIGLVIVDLLLPVCLGDGQCEVASFALANLANGEIDEFELLWTEGELGG
jgi:hypothetical protein